MSGGTGFVTDTRMCAHSNMWDAHHIEVPDRISRPLHKLQQHKILDRCQVLLPQSADAVKDIGRIHSTEYISKVAATKHMDNDQLEVASGEYEDVYFNNHTYDMALLSAGCALQATNAVLKAGQLGEGLHNAFALIRPPGHHAQRERACGFCFFNNVVLAAKTAADDHGLERVLIIDWDVHAPQGTQYLIRDDPRLQCFSIHRFDHGTFWPNLHDTNWDWPENTLNIPLNEEGMGDSAYMFILHHVLVPFVVEYKPQLILLSAGYDAALGDPQGEMRLTPACFAHMTHQLMSLGDGKLVALFEGGYFIDSVELDVLWTMKSLLGDAPPMLRCGLEPPRALVTVLLQLVAKHKHKYICFQQLLKTIEKLNKHTGKTMFTPAPVAPCKGEREMLLPHPLTGLYPARPTKQVADYRAMLQQFVSSYEIRASDLPILVNSESALWGDSKHMRLQSDVRLTIHSAIQSVMNDQAKLVLMQTPHSFTYSQFHHEISYWKKRLLMMTIGGEAARDMQVGDHCWALGVTIGRGYSFEHDKNRFTLQLDAQCTPADVFYLFQHVMMPVLYERAPELLVMHVTGSECYERFEPVLPYIMGRCSGLAVSRLLCTVNPAISDRVLQLMSQSVAYDQPNASQLEMTGSVSDGLHEMVAQCWLHTAQHNQCFAFAHKQYPLF